jgi:hypothetical protein
MSFELFISVLHAYIKKKKRVIYSYLDPFFFIKKKKKKELAYCVVSSIRLTRS